MTIALLTSSMALPLTTLQRALILDIKSYLSKYGYLSTDSFPFGNCEGI